MFFPASLVVLLMVKAAIGAPTSGIESVTTILENEDLTKIIIRLIPDEKIIELANEHSQTDENFKAAIRYLQNETFIKLLEIIQEKQEWQAFSDIVKQDTGLHISNIFECTVDFLRNIEVETTGTVEGSFKPFLMDLLKAIPLQDIMVFVSSKMNDSKVQELYNRMSSTKSKKIVADLIGLPEVKTALEWFSDVDLKLYDVLAFIFASFKWGEIQLPITYESLLAQLS